MKRVAICLSGEARSLEVTKDLFKSVENISDYQFDFFISTWKSGYDTTVKCFPHLKGCSILDESKYIEHTKIIKESNNFKYSFLLKHCNLLKQQYEYKNNFQYDCVIVTRLDIIFTNLINGLNQFFEDSERNSFNGLTIFTNDNIKLNNSMVQVDDNFSMMNSVTSDVYTNIHFLYYKDISNKRNHSLEINAYIVKRLGITYRQSVCSIIIIRPSSVYQWISTLTKNRALDYTWKDFRNKVINTKKSLNNLRIQSHVVGHVIIDLRDKQFMFDKIGYRTFLEAYFDNLAFRPKHSKVIYLTDKNKNLKEVIKSCIKNEVRPQEDLIMVTKPKRFLNFQYNNFYESAQYHDISYLTNNEKPINDIVIFKKEAKDKILDLQFNSIEDIDLNTFSSSFANTLTMPILDSTDLINVRNIYQTINKTIYN